MWITKIVQSPSTKQAVPLPPTLTQSKALIRNRDDHAKKYTLVAYAIIARKGNSTSVYIFERHFLRHVIVYASAIRQYLYVCVITSVAAALKCLSQPEAQELSEEGSGISTDITT